jgi:hypothetical protein
MLQTVAAWCVFGVLVWWWASTKWEDVPSPIRTVTHLWTPADTHSDDTEAATPTEHPANTSDTGTNAQDNTRDMRHDTIRQAWAGTVTDIRDLLFRRPTPTPGPAPAVTVADEPADHAQPVTEVSDEVPARVVVRYVQPGQWTGTANAVDEDGTPIIVRCETAPVPRPPERPVQRHDPVPALTHWLSTDHDEGAAPDVPAKVSAIEARRDWLRAMDANPLFAPEEVEGMYFEKFGIRSRRTLERDRTTLKERSDAARP